MDYTYELKLDLHPSGTMPFVKIKQGDASMRRLHVTITKDGAAYQVPQNAQVIFRCEKPDKTHVILDSSFVDEESDRYLIIIEQDGSLSVELVDQVSTAIGRCYCDLCIMMDGIISTIPFGILVLRSPSGAVLAVSTNDFRTLLNAIAQAESMMDGVEQQLCTLTLSTAWSGTNPFTEPVTVVGYPISSKTKVDLAANDEALEIMRVAGIWSIYVENNGGTLTAYAMGARKPSSPISVQAALYETANS